MSQPIGKAAWTWDDYLPWEADQPIRYELVSGEVYAMGGDTAEHDTIGNNLRGSCGHSYEASRAARMVRT